MFALKIRIKEAKIKPNIFLQGVKGIISSLAPIKKIIINAQSIYCKSPNTLNGVQSTMENKTPAKIPIPPRVGILLLWARLSSGSPVNILNLAILMMDGMIK